MEIGPLSHKDYGRVLEDLADFWDGDRTRGLHHPMFVREFGGSALVARDGEIIAGYLMGFAAPADTYGYIHLVAVRAGYRGFGVGRRLYRRFGVLMQERGSGSLRAITTPANTASLDFHRSLGFRSELVADYAGPGQDRVVLRRELPVPAGHGGGRER